MSDNSSKMTLEERVVQTIKSDTLMALVGDEDAILELTKRAVREALYQPTRIPDGYGRFAEKDSIAVAAARGVAKKAAEKIADLVIAEVMASDDFKNEVRVAIAKSIPGVMAEGISAAIRGEASDASWSACNDLAGRIMSGEFR